MLTPMGVNVFLLRSSSNLLLSEFLTMNGALLNGHADMNGTSNGHLNGFSSNGNHNGSIDDDTESRYSIHDSEEEEEDDALEALENWMDDNEESEGNNCFRIPEDREVKVLPKSIPKKKTESAKERARRASRELKKELNDTTGGTRVSQIKHNDVIKKNVAFFKGPSLLSKKKKAFEKKYRFSTILFVRNRGS